MVITWSSLVEHAAGQANQLRDAQARGVKRLEQRIDAQRPPLGRAFACLLHPLRRRLEQALDLGEGEQLRQGPSELRTVDRRAGIVGADALSQEEAEELTHGRELARPRGGGEPLAAELGKISAHIVSRSVARGLPLGGEEGKKLAQVACVGLDGLLGGAALGHEHVEEQRKLRLVAAP